MPRERLSEVKSTIEYEKKAMLSSVEYHCLTRCFFAPQSKMLVQVNHYYDTHKYELNDMDITCRIREKDGTYEATVKSHAQERKDCCIEKSREAKDQFDTSLFKDMNVTYQGNLTTIRKVLHLTSELRIMFDINFYLDFIDYELEVEYDGDNERLAEIEIRELSEILLKENLITSQSDFCKRFESSKSKSKRFFERKRALYK